MTKVALLSVLLLGSQQPTQDASGADYDVPPKILKQKKPAYPDEAFRKRTEGIVVVEFAVDKRGRAEDPRILESVPGLDEAALKAIEKWRFAPALKDGKPVRAIARVPVVFCIYEEGCRALSAKQSQHTTTK